MLVRLLTIEIIANERAGISAVIVKVAFTRIFTGQKRFALYVTKFFGRTRRFNVEFSSLFVIDRCSQETQITMVLCSTRSLLLLKPDLCGSTP